MFGPSTDRRPSGAGEVQHYLRGLEGYIERLGRSPDGRAQAESLAQRVSERLGSVAGALQERATRAGDDISRYGNSAAESGRDGLAFLAKEVSANPLAAVGAAVGIGFLIGVTMRRRIASPKPSHTRRVRKDSRK